MGNSSSSYIAKKAATLSNPITTAAVFVQSDSSSLSAFVSAAPTAGSSGVSLIDGKVIYLRMSGTVVVGASSSTFTPQIWLSKNARTTVAVTNATAVAGAASTSLAGGTYPFFLETELVWSFASLKLGGYYTQYVGIASGLTTQAITTGNVLTAVDLSVPTTGFLASGLMGTTQVGTVVTLSEFILEVM